MKIIGSPKVGDLVVLYTGQHWSLTRGILTGEVTQTVDEWGVTSHVSLQNPETEQINFGSEDFLMLAAEFDLVKATKGI